MRPRRCAPATICRGEEPYPASPLPRPTHPDTRYTPNIIQNLLNGTALSNYATVAAAKGSSGLKAVGLAVVPYTLAALSVYFVAHSAQRRDEHFLHVSIPLLVGGTILALFPALATAHAVGGFLSLSLSLAIAAAANGTGVALASRMCKGPEQVVALPLFSSFNVLGGIIGPFVVNALMTTQVGRERASVCTVVLDEC